jgi:filamentous hemagglutinin family protein
MKSTRRHLATLALLPLLLTFGVKGAIAQITPAKDGTGTVVQTQNNQINISGGTQAGQNQFHSFQQFGVNAGQTANFMANPNIANILGRVTGGDASLINGILKVTGSNANLFLINPSGIVFGKDASLNVPAAFTATTANGIGFGNGNWWSAVGSNNYASLTSNPTSFGFIGTSGSLVNAGNLSVNPGQSIALVGGTVVNTGTIAAPGGNITIAAIPGEKMVRIGQAGTVLSLDLPTSDRALINAPITTPLSLPALLTGGSIPSAMGVVVEDGVIRLTDGSASVTGTLNADGTGLQSGGNVVAYADKHLSFGGTISAKGGELGGNGGFVDTSGKGTIAISPNAKVLTTAAKGLTGTWLIDPADLEVVAGTGGTIASGTNSPTTASTIGADTIVTALNGTNVNLQADNSITMNAAINSSANASAGNLTLTAPTANLNQAIVLKIGSTLSGTATTVNVGATGTVQNGVDVSAANGTVNLAAAIYTLAQEVGINKNVTVRGAGAGTTTVSGNNAVRGFNVGAGSTVTLDGMSIVKGRSTTHGGGIFNKGTLIVSNSAISGNFAQSFGGGILSDAGTLTVSNSTISGNSTQASGGGIYNYNNGTLTVNNSTISGNSVPVNGGGIRHTGNGIFNISNSTVTNNTAGGIGGGIANGIGVFNIGNTIVSGNTSSIGREINGSFTSKGYNLFGYSGTNGLLGGTAAGTDITPTVALNQIIGALANNGGLTQTHALVANSPALNAGGPTNTLTIDQRGGQRGSAGLNAGSRIDIGAYEATSSALVTNTLDDTAAGSLRSAINFANGNINPIATTTPTDIQFKIGTVGSAQTIALTSALPSITTR